MAAEAPQDQQGKALAARIAGGAAGLQGVLGFMGASQQYKADQRAYKLNKDLAYQGMRESYGDIWSRALEEIVAVREHMVDLQMEHMAQRSRAEVAAGEAGVAGNSVDAAIGDLRGQLGRHYSRSQTNLDISLAQLKRQGAGVRTQTMSQILSRSPGSKPSLLGGLVSTGANMASAYYGAK